VNLIAMIVLRNEADRYLALALRHLLEFVDEVRIFDDASTDAFRDIGWVEDNDLDADRVFVQRSSRSTFYEHEGRTRQMLLDWALQGDPTHLLATDADEFVSDGAALRRAIECNDSRTGVWKLTMTEVWGADKEGLDVRVDGMWGPRPMGIAFAVPQNRASDRQMRRHWRMPNQACACGRVPVATQMAANRTINPPVTDILHWGWTRKAEREARYRRYADKDGFGHDSKHIQSIMYDDRRVRTRKIPWPLALDREALLKKVQG